MDTGNTSNIKSLSASRRIPNRLGTRVSNLAGDPETARIILRELVNSTIGFEILAREMDKSGKSLHRMLSPQGNPTMDNLTQILVALQKGLNTNLKVVLSSHNKTSKRLENRRLA